MKIETLLRKHGRWDIRPPDRTDRYWCVFPEYAPLECGAYGRTLEDALRLSVRRIRARDRGARREELRALGADKEPGR